MVEYMRTVIDCNTRVILITSCHCCRLSDGGLLVALDGASYTTYMKEDAIGYRLIVGNKTCMFEKENDPSVLRLVALYTVV
jgi:hypothetical protein